MYCSLDATGEDRGFVAEVREVRSREAGSLSRDRGQVDVCGERLVARVHAEDRLAPCDVGGRHEDLAVEPARTEKRGVEILKAVRRRHDDDLVAVVEAVELDEELVQGLIVLAMETAAACGPCRRRRARR